MELNVLLTETSPELTLISGWIGNKFPQREINESYILNDWVLGDILDVSVPLK